MKLPPQIFVSHSKPTPKKITQVELDTFWKPRGGLWTSTETESGGQWVDWLHDQQYSLDTDDRWGGKCWRLIPKDANIYVIDNPDDLYALVERFPHPERARYIKMGLDSFDALVDWPAVAEVYDAIHCPNPWPHRFPTLVGQERVDKYGASMFFYTLDAESTCWFRWCFEDDPIIVDYARVEALDA